MKTIAFEVYGLPRAQGRPRAVKRGSWVDVVDDKNSAAAKENFRAQAIMSARPPVPLSGPLHVLLDFVFPVPASWPEWRRAAALAGYVPHTSRPDLDNLQKLALDALNQIFWADDAQIFEIKSSKRYGPAALTRVKIDQVEEPESAQEWRGRAPAQEAARA